MTVCLLLLMATFGIGVAGSFGLAMSLSRQERYTGSVVVGWLVSWAALTALSCTLAYLDLHASALEMFPNGYHP